MSTEEWRELPGTWGYEVSNLGRVRSWRPCRGEALPRMLRPTIANGYRVLNVMVDGKAKLRRLHQLVLEAFVGPRPDWASGVRHLDGDQTNNFLANLAYGTHAENMRDRRTHGTDPNLRKTHCPDNHPYGGDNLWVDKNGRRHCRACNAARQQRYYWAKKAVSA